MDINQIKEKMLKDFQPSELYAITKCWDCPNAVMEISKVEEDLKKLLKEIDFSQKQQERLGGAKPKPHDVFSLAIAGCPNSCCQPQIKDFALQGQAVPRIGGGCTGCGQCVEGCPDRAITLNEEGPVIDRDLCLNCGQCAGICPTATISIGQRGYRVTRGGKLGRRPRLAGEICALTNEQGALSLLKETIDLLHGEGNPRERLGTLLGRLKIY